MQPLTRRLSSHLARHWPAWLAALGAFSLFGFRFGFDIIDPRQSAWLLNRQDPATTYISWLFYRSEPWSFPLGLVQGYLAPIGTTIGLTDSLPLLAVPFKALRSLLPETFQYFGTWVLANYILQSVFGYLITSRFTRHHGLRLVGAAFFLFSPIFLIKENHTALSAHWLLLAALWLYLAPPAQVGARWFARWWGSLLVVVCAVHPYLAVMVLALGWAALLRAWWADRRLHWGQAAGLALAAPVLMLLVWSVLGFKPGGNINPEAGPLWGTTALNLNGLVNPLDTSLLLPELPVAHANKFEGYAYLGVGLMTALLAGMAWWLLSRLDVWRGKHGLQPEATAEDPAGTMGSCRSYWPLAGVLLLLGLRALGDAPAWGTHELVHYELPGVLQALVNPFRAAGRFAWPLVYGLLTVVVALAAGLSGRQGARARWRRGVVVGLAVCCGLQVADVSAILDQRGVYQGLQWESRLRSSEWEDALADVDRVLTYPPFAMSTNFELDFKDLALLARGHGLATSAGYAARLPHDAVTENIASLQEQMFAGRADPRAIYVLRTSYFAEKFPDMREEFLATDLDGFKVCVPLTGTWRPERIYLVRPVTLAEYLGQIAEHTAILAVKGGYGLQPEARAMLESRGAPLAGYRPGDAFVVLMHGGQSLFDQVLGDRVFESGAAAGDVVGPVRLQRDLLIAAAGDRAGARVLIEVGGRATSFNTRGLNIVVLNEVQEVVEVASFPLENGENAGHAFGMVGRR